MNAKNLIAVALLMFVAGSVVMLVVREMQQKPLDEPTAIAKQPTNALVVYYFHGEKRCPTCRKIEDYSHETVQAAFAEELAQDRVLWRVVNYEEAENSHFATDYEIVAPTVVLVRTTDGEVAEWRNLDRVWELVGDQDAFADYVQNETRSMLGS